MKLIQKIKESSSAVRWKMLVIFAFSAVISTILVASGAAAVLNVVIRRANSTLIEERINGVVDSNNRFTPYLLEQVANVPNASFKFARTGGMSGRCMAGRREFGERATDGSTRCDETQLARCRLFRRYSCRSSNSRDPLLPFGGTRRMLDIGASSDTAD